MILPLILPTQQISFADLGWQDYIVQPSSYPANFCGGGLTISAQRFGFPFQRS